MDIGQFEALARAHLRKLLAYFIGSLTLALVSYSVADWADADRGWESDVASFVFHAIAALAALSTLIFGGLVYSWFASYRVAKSDAAHFDFETLRRLRRDVIGPIPWK